MLHIYTEIYDFSKDTTFFFKFYHRKQMLLIDIFHLSLIQGCFQVLCLNVLGTYIRYNCIFSVIHSNLFIMKCI